MSSASSRAELLAASLPPHLKLLILQQAQQQQQQQQSISERNAAVPSSTVDAAIAQSSATDPSIPSPFVLTPAALKRAAASTADAVASSDGVNRNTLRPAVLRALATHGFAVIDGFALDCAAEEEQGHASNHSQHQDSGSNNCSNSGNNSDSRNSCRSHTLQRALEEARTLYCSNLMAHAGMKASASAAAASAVAATAASSSSVGASAGEPVPAVASSSSPVAASSASSSTVGTPAPTATAASTAAAAGGWKSASLRGDHHLWLHADSASERARSPALFALLDRLDALRGELNHVLLSPPGGDGDDGADGDGSSGSGGTGWKASTRSQVQLACYRGLGSRYVAHRDSVPGQAPHRRITAILYLNQDWRGREQHGGCLRLFTKQQQRQLDGDADDADDATSRMMLPYFTATASGLEQPQPPPADSVFSAPDASDAASAPSTDAASSAPASSSGSSSSSLLLPAWIDLAPIAHRLLLFSSAEMLHEVRPSHADERFAITLWME